MFEMRQSILKDKCKNLLLLLWVLAIGAGSFLLNHFFCAGVSEGRVSERTYLEESIYD